MFEATNLFFIFDSIWLWDHYLRLSTYLCFIFLSWTKVVNFGWKNHQIVNLLTHIDTKSCQFGLDVSKELSKLSPSLMKCSLQDWNNELLLLNYWTGVCDWYDLFRWWLSPIQYSENTQVLLCHIIRFCFQNRRSELTRKKTDC